MNTKELCVILLTLITLVSLLFSGVAAYGRKKREQQNVLALLEKHVVVGVTADSDGRLYFRLSNGTLVSLHYRDTQWQIIEP